MKTMMKTIHPPIEIPDYIEPITAYRVWQWDAEGVKSLNHTLWTPGEAMTAKCQKFPHFPSHLPPHPDCTCGLYAAHDWWHLLNIGYLAHGNIHGEVNLWGQVQEHAAGYRAQYQYPKFFIIRPRAIIWNMQGVEGRLDELARFGVDIYISDSDIPQADEVETKIPLWVKDYGYSAQGVAFIHECIQRYYQYRDDDPDRELVVGDQIAILGQGIAVLAHSPFRDMGAAPQLVLKLWNGHLLQVNKRDVRWDRKNNRWEMVPGAPLTLIPQLYKHNYWAERATRPRPLNYLVQGGY